MATTQITLSVKDDGSATIEKVSGKLRAMEQDAKRVAASMSSSFDSLKQNWIGISAAVTAAGFAFSKVFAMAEGAAQLEENIGRLARQTGEFNVTARQMAESVQEAANGQLSFAESVKLSSQALAQSFSPEQVVQFAKLAEVASDVLGGSIAQNFDQLVTSVATGRTTVLKQIGILVDLEEEKKKLALSTNRLVADISLAEGKQILLNAVMAKAPGVMKNLGDATMSRSDEIAVFKAQMEDATDVLSAFALEAGQKTVGVLQGLASGWASLFDDKRAHAPRLMELAVRNLGLATDEAVGGIEDHIVKTQRLGDAMVEAFHKQEGLFQAVTVGSQTHHVAAWEIEQEKIATKGLAEAISVLAAAHAGLQSVSERAFDRELAGLGTVEDRIRKLRQAMGDTTDPKELERLLGKTGALRSEAEQRGKTSADAEAKLLELEKQREAVASQSMIGSREQLNARREQLDAVEEQIRRQKEFLNTLAATGGQATDDVDRLGRDIEGKLKDAYTSTLEGAHADFLTLSQAINNGKAPAEEYATLLRDGFSGAAEQARHLREAVESVNASLGRLNNEQLAAFALAKQTVSNNRALSALVVSSFNDRTGQSLSVTEGGLRQELLGQQIVDSALSAGDAGGFAAEIPAFARGGIVRRPTLALVGEAGPEAIVPLNGREGAAAGVTVNITLHVNGGFSTEAEITRTVRDVLVPKLREVLR